MNNENIKLINILFLKGSWKIWNPKEIWNELNVIQFDKNAVMDHFGLTYQQMPLFAVLATGKLPTVHQCEVCHTNAFYCYIIKTFVFMISLEDMELLWQTISI